MDISKVGPQQVTGFRSDVRSSMWTRQTARHAGTEEIGRALPPFLPLTRGCDSQRNRVRSSRYRPATRCNLGVLPPTPRRSLPLWTAYVKRDVSPSSPTIRPIAQAAATLEGTTTRAKQMRPPLALTNSSQTKLTISVHSLLIHSSCSDLIPLTGSSD